METLKRASISNQVSHLIKIFKILYLVLGIIGIAGLFTNLINYYYGFNPFNPTATFVSLTGGIVGLGFYIGIRRIEPWTPTTIVIITLVTLLYSLYVNIIIPDKNILYVLWEPIVWIWDIFTIYFFSRKDIRNYFKTKGATLFSI